MTPDAGRNAVDQQDAGSDNAAAEQITAMVESILDSNPGMNEIAARRVAEATFDPSSPPPSKMSNRIPEGETVAYIGEPTRLPRCR